MVVVAAHRSQSRGALRNEVLGLFLLKAQFFFLPACRALFRAAKYLGFWRPGRRAKSALCPGLQNSGPSGHRQLPQKPNFLSLVLSVSPCLRG